MKPKPCIWYVGLLLFLPNFLFAQTFFTANFTTAQQSHDVVSADSASGTAALVLDAEGLHYHITVANLSGPIAAAHFHNGAAGVDGGVLRAVSGDFVGGTASGVWTSADAEPLSDEALQALMAGNLYLNIHTAANPAGELRAQIRPTSGAGLSAYLTTAQENHDVTVSAEGVTPTGTASMQLTDAGLAFHISIYGLVTPLVGAHFHHAPIGEDGPVVRGITDAFGEGTLGGATAFGVWSPTDDAPLSPEMVTELLAGNLYLNIHSSANQAGLMRGQIMLSEGVGFSASLDAAQEPGGVTSDALGTASLTLTDAGLTYAVAVTGLEEGINAAHIHNAPAGENGPVVHALAFDGHTAYGTWGRSNGEPLTIALVQELLRGNLYFNVHTASNPGGEIRGQILLDPGTSFTALLTPAQENHDVTGAENARGVAHLSLTLAGLAYHITVDSLSGDVAAAHFHQAPIGEDGGVLRTITFDGNTATGTWGPGDDEPLTAEGLAALMTGSLYLNVHTGANGSGELRGQVLLSSGTQLRASLTEAQENHDVSGTGEAEGTATMTLTAAGLTFNATSETLTGPIAAMHFHRAAAGEDGGVVRSVGEDLIPDSKTVHGFWSALAAADPLTPELRNALLAGDLYLNVHTGANGPGEIRGQVYLSAGTGVAVALSPDQETHDVVDADSAAGTASVTITNAGVVFDLTVADLSGPIAAAHIHNAPFGENGGVVRTITDDFGSPTAFGVWRTIDPEPLTLELSNELLAGNLYFNVHTAANGPGEVRGQIRTAQGRITSVEPVDGGVIPQSIALDANYPNPFNPSTTLTFSVPEALPATLRVFNALGQTVAVLVNETLAAGRYQVTFDAAGLPSGIYFYQLEAAGVQETRKMMLLK